MLRHYFNILLEELDSVFNILPDQFLHPSVDDHNYPSQLLNEEKRVYPHMKGSFPLDYKYSSPWAKERCLIVLKMASVYFCFIQASNMKMCV